MANLGQHAMLTLLLMTRDLFPHDRLAMQHYAVVVDNLDKRAVTDAAAGQLLVEGVARLDAALNTPWINLDDSAREAVLRKMEATEFFAMVRLSAINGLYGNPLVYKTFGYVGSSIEFGGYIDRGFDDINWLSDT
jgi:hypothetical protein